MGSWREIEESRLDCVPDAPRHAVSHAFCELDTSLLAWLRLQLFLSHLGHHLRLLRCRSLLLMAASLQHRELLPEVPGSLVVPEQQQGPR